MNTPSISPIAAANVTPTAFLPNRRLIRLFEVKRQAKEELRNELSGFSAQ
jgi:hypothetical protein